MNTRWHDLIIDRLPDGGIHLEQQANYEEPNVIHLHPVQLRHIAEQFGLVAPNYPADDLSKTLAWQLCDIHRELESERYRSHWLELTFAKLDGYCASIPAAIIPDDFCDNAPTECTADSSGSDGVNQPAEKSKGKAVPVVGTGDDKQIDLL